MKRKTYQSPSIEIIEAEVQQPIAASNVQSLTVTGWGPETDEGEITDGSGN